MKPARGFSFAGVHAGIKAARKDLALVVSEAPAVCVGRFTTNLAAAAPVVDARARLPSACVRALVLNSGNANALTGPAGLADCALVREAVARALDVDAGAVVAASTGVIGVRLPAQKLCDAAPRLVAALGPAIEAAAEAIFTTDTRIKVAGRELETARGAVRVSAFAKGSGMAHPALATVLAVVVTDAALDESTLGRALDRALPASFGSLTVDGETSTNDAVFAMANGASGVTPRGDDLARVERAIAEVLLELARAVAEDGEGATRALTVEVRGAPTEEIARELARAVAGSPLVKAAIFGADPNWGRIVAAVGARAGARGHDVDVGACSVRLQGVDVFVDGAPVDAPRAALVAKMREPEVHVEVTLPGGHAAASAFGCDLSYDYVKINADYARAITAADDGTVTRDDRLTNYTPGFKRALLVEALSYISAFAGTRAVIACGPAELATPARRATFAADVNLLASAGLRPIVVHGAGRDSASLTDELVQLVNRDGARAVGVSGEDGGFLRARREPDLRYVAAVDPTLVEVLLDRRYVPVIAPVALADDGASVELALPDAAASIAVALHAEKLIFLGSTPGLLDGGELVSEVSLASLVGRAEPEITAARAAIGGGVRRVHLLDGRVPHSVIAELFTDKGVGTLIVE
ncbi:MAG: bifunctional glutamate N-acetyltransferase/amino-acid acetyltransferase ArgJ [Polyangiaceae bacterium]|nr:bifunctional glutamate N-acetyltransferase/amino-acid acetyltransferase ArgJ [Polyangiaceae bacterium]